VEETDRKGRARATGWRPPAIRDFSSKAVENAGSAAPRAPPARVQPGFEVGNAQPSEKGHARGWCQHSEGNQPRFGRISKPGGTAPPLAGAVTRLSRPTGGGEGRVTRRLTMGGLHTRDRPRSRWKAGSPGPHRQGGEYGHSKLP